MRPTRLLTPSAVAALGLLLGAPGAQARNGLDDGPAVSGYARQVADGPRSDPDPLEEKTREARADRRTTPDLVEAILAERRRDPGAGWDMVTLLHFRATRDVLEQARGLAAAPGPERRVLGVDVLGQLGVPERAFPDECQAIVSEPLESESDPFVLSRGDEGVLVPLLHELSGGEVGRLAVEAAEHLASPRLLPALRRLAEWWEVDAGLLERAVAACSPKPS